MKFQVGLEKPRCQRWSRSTAYEMAMPLALVKLAAQRSNCLVWSFEYAAPDQFAIRKGFIAAAVAPSTMSETRQPAIRSECQFMPRTIVVGGSGRRPDSLARRAPQGPGRPVYKTMHAAV